MRAFTTAAVAMVLLGGALPPAGLAQQATGESDDLTQAILRFAFRYEGGHVRVVRGEVPEDLRAQFYAPPGTRVLGTVVRNSGALVLATTNTPPESLRVLYTRALEPKGWRPSEVMRQGGFVSSAAEVPIILCRQDAQLMVTSDRRASGAHDLYLDYREAFGPCAEEGRAVATVSSSAAFVVGRAEPRFPTLYSPPPPADVTTACYGRMSPRFRGSMGTGAMVPTTMSADELLAHYARQLEATGWKAPVGAPGRSVATGTWVRTDSTGTSQVTLEVRGTSGPCYDVQMRLSEGPPGR
jgi:hypothetical protein